MSSFEHAIVFHSEKLAVIINEIVIHNNDRMK